MLLLRFARRGKGLADLAERPDIAVAASGLFAFSSADGTRTLRRDPPHAPICFRGIKGGAERNGRVMADLKVLGLGVAAPGVITGKLLENSNLHEYSVAILDPRQ